MSVPFTEGVDIQIPRGWTDKGTVVAMPPAPAAGQKPTINLVVKRRPQPQADVEAGLKAYLGFMTQAFGALEGLQVREMRSGRVVGKAVRFGASGLGKRFSQTTLMYCHRGEEVSATVTQLEGDTTPSTEVDALLRSVLPAHHDPVVP